MNQIDAATLRNWATDSKAPVALYLRQKLEPVESDPDHRIIYPPTYADIGYNVDTLSDGTKVALIDSVGSQANRMEPLFISESDDPNEWLVPQVWIKVNDETRVSLLELAHRAADAVARSCPGLNRQLDQAFAALKDGDAWPLATLAPTSLIFGVWDSRGPSQEKRPRLVRAIVRAWDVEVLHAAAQFNSVWKRLDEHQQNELKKAAKKKKDLSELGFADAPAVFRKTKTKQWLDEGGPNPEARVLGGVLVKGPILREVTINLNALRQLKAGNDPQKTEQLRVYLLGLSLKAATAEIDLFFREGCHLRLAEERDEWTSVPRRGEPKPVELSKHVIDQFLHEGLEVFRAEWQKLDTLEFEFDLNEAKKLLKTAKTEEE